MNEQKQTLLVHWSLLLTALFLGDPHTLFFSVTAPYIFVGFLSPLLKRKLLGARTMTNCFNAVSLALSTIPPHNWASVNF